MFKFSDLYNAYEEADFGRESGTRTLINIAGEKIVVIPGMDVAGFDEIEALEEEVENGDWIELPSKYDLNLGKELIFRFASEHLPEKDCRRIERFFSHSGAYGNCKDFFADHNLLDKWYEYEENEKEKALKDWLVDMEIPFEDKTQSADT